MSMCITSRTSTFHNMIASITKAEIIYSKEYEGGTLYALIHTRPEKKHSTLDREISALDDILTTTHKTSTTFFKSISPHYTGKVKTFENSEHVDDPLFHVIFNVHQSGAAIGRKYNIQPGVRRFPEQQKSTEEAANEQANETNTSSCDTPRKRRRVDNDSIGESAGAASKSKEYELQSALAEKDADVTQLVTANDTIQAIANERDNAYVEIEKLRSIYETYRTTTAGEIDKLENTIKAKDKEISTVAGDKDKMIEMLKFQLESLTNAFGSRMDQFTSQMEQLQSTADDAKLQSAQHTNDIETKIDQVRTAVISRAEGTGRQIASLEDSLTTALDSHWETMVAEMERVMQEKGTCEQHIMEQCQQAIAKAHSYAQTKKGVFTRKLNEVKRAFAAKIRKLEMELMVETRLRQCVIDNFFELIPTSTDRQT